MKKIIILVIIFFTIILVGVLAQSYLIGGMIKLSTVELPNPKFTYFVENIKHNFGQKLIISIIFSTVITTTVGILFFRKKVWTST
jgi:hypothetical protein